MIMKEYIFLIGFLQEIPANYTNRFFKCSFAVSRYVSILVKLAHSRKAVYCYIVVSVTIKSRRVVCKSQTN
jgi:hypothetical protein